MTQSIKDHHVLCHQHHLEMKLHEILSESGREGTQTIAFTYACTEPKCTVHYNFSRGYFLPGQKGGANEREMAPSLKCPRDGMSLYLAGISTEKRSFRLWKCPQCNGKCTNDEGLLL